MKIWTLFSTLVLTTTIAMAGEVTITLPPETAAFKAGSGAELAQANCLICHSADYISSQPPMPRKFWEASVKKMIEKYAAPTPPEVTAAIAEYLTATYGVPDAPVAKP
jgi:mono/diheme cytochrome c family protein